MKRTVIYRLNRSEIDNAIILYMRNIKGIEIGGEQVSLINDEGNYVTDAQATVTYEKEVK